MGLIKMDYVLFAKAYVSALVAQDMTW